MNILISASLDRTVAEIPNRRRPEDTQAVYKESNGLHQPVFGGIFIKLGQGDAAIVSEVIL